MSQWNQIEHSRAMMPLLNSGAGNLIGYLGTGAWFAACARPTGTPVLRSGTAEGGQWQLFWSGLAAVVAVVLVYFLAAYRRRAAVIVEFRLTRDFAGN